MPDYYQIPALVLTALLLPAFAHLYLRFRNTRTLLWFLAFLFAVVRMGLLYRLGSWDLGTGSHPWMVAAGEASIQLSSALFLASLSPLGFRIGKVHILYVIPYTVPLLIYSILYHGVFRGQAPQGALYWIFPALGLVAFVAACFWCFEKGVMPRGLSGLACFFMGVSAFWLCLKVGAQWPLLFVECGNHFMTALLVIFVFRRISTGMFLAVLGFAVWSLPIFLILSPIAHNPALDLHLTRAIILAKVIAALGMILLALEDELATNKAAEERERRARREMEAYASLVLTRRRVEDFDGQAAEICQIVAANSRFAGAALLLLQSSGRYRVAGTAGMGEATPAALDLLAARIPVAGFLAPGAVPTAVEHSQTLNLSLEPWMKPGDDLKRLRFTSALAIPMHGRSATEGALLLTGLRNPQEPLRRDDLLPVEILTARLQAVRSQTLMLEKLIDSEKFAGLGQLAGNVTQQLNNPLTVILGYASLLDDTANLEPQERKGVEAILIEARRMRATLESLSRISRSHNDQFAAVSVSELLADMEQLHRPEFLRRSIEFHLNIAPALPLVRGNAQQLRQAVLHCLQFAIEAVDSLDPSEERTIRLEAAAEGSHVQILVAHSGPGFLHPERAFDPFVPAQSGGENAALGLSLCATILRDHNGRASAANFEPSGAAIILEMQAA
jgi:signal transduction histidine kinase